ncbi:uncharacterized protein [Watersipora subatra]|uniref:uncharacterized protein n=1 Tax=Watersipora subatra TaxID=2589382 RepID=UPI00355C086E
MGSKVVLSLALAAVCVFLASAYKSGGNYPAASSRRYAPSPSHYQVPTATNYRAPASTHHQAPVQKSYIVKYWSEWGHYGACSATCGWGEQRRYRTCLSKREYGYGNSVHQCNGPSYSKKRCYGGKPIDGGWSHWSSWATIQGYQQKRTRQCNYPVPSCGGRNCYGSSFETRNVHTPKTYAPAPGYRQPSANTHYRAPNRNTQYRASADNTHYRAPVQSHRANYPTQNTRYQDRVGAY